MTLADQTISGVRWSFVSHFGRQGIQLATVVILARLLGPDDFGLLGMAMVVIGFVSIFGDLGTSSAVIQKRDLSPELLSSIFWLNGAFGVLAVALFAAGAPVVAGFFGEPRLAPILPALSMTFVLSGLSSLQQVLFERDLAFRTVARVEIVAILAGSVVGIGSAVMGYGVWSLVFQTLTVGLVTAVLLWGISPWRPKFLFRWSALKSIGGYSLNLTGFRIFNYFARNGDSFLIGKFLGAQELGYYSLAYRIMLYPVSGISAVIGRVMFPAYSQIQGDDSRFRRIYLTVAGTIALVTFPMMLGLIATASPLVYFVFGHHWEPSILILVILAPVGLIQSIETTAGVIYQAKGRTDLLLRFGIIAGLLVILAFVIGLEWGIVGVAGAYLAADLLIVYPNFAIPFRLIGLRFRELLGVLWKPFLCGSFMFVSVLGLARLLPADLPGKAVLAILVAAGIVLYASVSWIVNRDQINYLLRLVGNRE